MQAAIAAVAVDKEQAVFDLSTKTVIIETPAPISMEDLQKSFGEDGANVGYLIDYATSKSRGRGLLVYLSNLEVPCNIRITRDIPKEERFELITEYMNMRNLLGCEVLAVTVASILTALKGIDDFYQLVEEPILSQEETVEFIRENQILVNKWRVFMDSMVVFTLNASNKFKEAFGDPKHMFPVVDDAQAVGNNVVNLFQLPSFLELFFSIPGTELYYFTKQFEDYMFAQKNLFYYYMNPMNPLPMLLEMMGSVEYNVEDLVHNLDTYEARLFEE